MLWDKVANVTTTNGRNTGIVFLFDPFVAAGAAVAFPGRDSVNCPAGWMPQALNYEGLVTSGSWGNFHEYHHNFQNYGVTSGANGEVTNNALNLVSYSLFTKISSKRGMGSYGGQGLGGWNNYTSAPWVIRQVNTGSITSTNGLAIYATLLHNFGQDAFIKARGANGTNAYLDKWANLTHQDMTYFASMITAYGTGTYNPSAAVQSANYPLFVPVASVYQTGRSYLYDGETRDIKTMQPYVIPYGKQFTVDLRPYTAPDGQYANGSVVICKGFTYKVKEVTQPSNGKLEATDTEGVYTYTPDKKNKSLLSGQMRVTLEIYNADDNSRMYNGHALEDVDLIIEFEQSHETNKMTLDRTTYTYAPEAMYKDAVEAYEKGFKGYATVVEQDQFNPTQNCNTDIWFRPDNEKTHNQYPNDPDKYFVHENNIDVVDGKLYFDADGKYRVYLRGRDNCALYFSLDGEKYTLGAKINESTPTNGATANFRVNAPETYFDVQFDEGKVTVTLYVNGGATKEYTLKLKDGKKEIENWLYIKEVLIVHSSPNVSYIGVGMKQWDQAMFTIQEEYFKDDGKTTVGSPEDDGYSYTKTTYKNYLGVAVAYTTNKNGRTEYFKQNGDKITSKEFSQMTESKLIEPTSANYVNAYRSSYEFKTQFESEYFYKRSYSYNYKDNVSVPSEEITLTSSNYSAPPKGWGWGSFPIENLTDGKTNTYIHTSWKVSANKPLDMTFDLGAERTINRITFYCRNNNGMLETPKAFTVEGSLDGITWFNVAEFTNAPRNGNQVTANFDETTLHYCRIKISAAHQNNGDYYIVLGQITFTHSTEVLGGKQYTPDDDMFTYKGKWSGVQTTSTFGHVSIGASGAKMSFEFTGTRIALLSS
ncbi:MAG: M60 family metallopeptidase, partial [Clostridia bacterium]|nr:M60 family metallopeptidase [Clostridia bacterium]